MKIYMDLSTIMQVDFITGIQRVVREITVRIMQHTEHEFYLLTYSCKNNCFLRLSNKRFLDYFLEGKGEKGAILTPEKIGYRDIPSGAVFFELDSVWNALLKRSSAMRTPARTLWCISVLTSNTPTSSSPPRRLQ